jgi:hypothetical protein
MILHMQRRWKSSEPMQICVGESIIPVRRVPPREVLQDYRELRWTWIDGLMYTLFCHVDAIRGKATYRIKRKSDLVCSGALVHPKTRDAILRAASPRMFWTCDEQPFGDAVWCCGGELRDGRQRRIAVWKNGRAAKVAIGTRGAAPEPAIVAGMVMSRLVLQEG